MQALSLNSVFGALSDPTRRAFLSLLARGPQSVSALASEVPISLPAVSRHLKVLEAAGLIVREKRGRTTWCRLAPKSLDEAERFMTQTRTSWNVRLDRLAALLEDPNG